MRNVSDTPTLSGEDIPNVISNNGPYSGLPKVQEN